MSLTALFLILAVASITPIYFVKTHRGIFMCALAICFFGLCACVAVHFE